LHNTTDIYAHGIGCTHRRAKHNRQRSGKPAGGSFKRNRCSPYANFYSNRKPDDAGRDRGQQYNVYDHHDSSKWVYRNGDAERDGIACRSHGGIQSGDDYGRSRDHYPHSVHHRRRARRDFDADHQRNQRSGCAQRNGNAGGIELQLDGDADNASSYGGRKHELHHDRCCGKRIHGNSDTNCGRAAGRSYGDIQSGNDYGRSRNDHLDSVYNQRLAGRNFNADHQRNQRSGCAHSNGNAGGIKLQLDGDSSYATGSDWRKYQLCSDGRDGKRVHGDGDADCDRAASRSDGKLQPSDNRGIWDVNTHDNNGRNHTCGDFHANDYRDEWNGRANGDDNAGGGGLHIGSDSDDSNSGGGQQHNLYDYYDSREWVHGNSDPYRNGLTCRSNGKLQPSHHRGSRSYDSDYCDDDRCDTGELHAHGFRYVRPQTSYRYGVFDSPRFTRFQHHSDTGNTADCNWWNH
jgi:hypothetical protein